MKKFIVFVSFFLLSKGLFGQGMSLDPSFKFWNDRSNWVFPLMGDNYSVDNSSGRQFGFLRDGGARSHAGIDLKPLDGVGINVVSMTDGIVSKYSAEFYEGTQAIAIENTDGSIARYCEISTDLREGDYVRKGQLIGKVIKNNNGNYMLHLEVYMGTTYGPLTDRGNTFYQYVPQANYQRRSDLINPMGVTRLMHVCIQ